MAYNTRSRQQELRPVPPLPCLQTRRHKASRSSAEESNPQRGENGSTLEPNHTSAIFSLSGISPDISDDETDTLPTPIPIHRRDVSNLSKRQGQIGSSAGDASPDLGFQGAYEPTMPEHAETQPRIIHFDFSKYKASTPGSESCPIKIEDSPKTSSSLPIHGWIACVDQEPLGLSMPPPDQPAIWHGYPSGDTSQVKNGHAGKSSFMILPADLLLSEGVTSITTSPKAATTFLRCFLASEKYWLRSLDHDMDPDTRFWGNILKQFNAGPHGYSINGWPTARAIATTLCSESYKVQVEQQLPGVDDELSTLISAIVDCRCMSQRRRRGQRPSIGKAKTSTDGVAVRGDAKGVLGKKPQTLEDQNNLIQALGTMVRAKSTHTTAPKADNSKTGPGLNIQNKRKGVHHQPHTANSPSSNNNIVPCKGPKNNAGATRHNPNKMAKIWGKGNDRPPGVYPHAPTGTVRQNWRGDPSSSRFAAQDQDKRRLEQRVRDLERTINSLKRPRYI
ncbi:hypothetical protein F4803DRAFT_556088 [Xylaria telfairii]|nr:hypothetical protein F4803DRAFT_556088 [Xylaria telfairii]